MPIIKSKGRKDSNYAQLIQYIWKGASVPSKGIQAADTFTIMHNLLSHEIEDIISEFEENGHYASNRKNGAKMMHEILSFSPEDSEHITPEILEDIAKRYIKLRLGDKEALCFAKPHFDKDHYHIHFCFSNNEVMSAKTIRLSKSEFKDIRLSLEKYQLAQYPIISESAKFTEKHDPIRAKAPKNHKRAIAPEILAAAYRPTTDGEAQIKSRGEVPEKERVFHLLRQSIGQSKSLISLKKELQKEGVELYSYRGKLAGIQATNPKSQKVKKYRFKTLLKNDEKSLTIIESWQVVGATKTKLKTKRDKVRKERKALVEKKPIIYQSPPDEKKPTGKVPDPPPSSTPAPNQKPLTRQEKLRQKRAAIRAKRAKEREQGKDLDQDIDD